MHCAPVAEVAPSAYYIPTPCGVGDAYLGVPEAHGSEREGCAVIYASSFVSWTRCVVFRVGLLVPLTGALLFGLAVGAGSLLVAGSALADTALRLRPRATGSMHCGRSKQNSLTSCYLR